MAYVKCIKKLMFGCGLATVLMSTGCSQFWENYRNQVAYDTAQRKAAIARMTPMDHYAVEYCSNQGTMASINSRGIVNSVFNSLATESICIDFYNRTGHLPGQAF